MLRSSAFWPATATGPTVPMTIAPGGEILTAVGGACTAAAFLQNFVGEKPWVHLDIAGTAWIEGQAWVPPYLAKGLATGVGVRLLEEFARCWAEEA